VLTQDQTPIIDFLSRRETHGGAPVERIDTHTSIVFLAGRLAYKLKRAVAFDYLDFSSVERRRVCCHDELRLNQRTAPAIYRWTSCCRWLTRSRDCMRAPSDGPTTAAAPAWRGSSTAMRPGSVNSPVVFSNAPPWNG
jgi:hypothetical protein